MRLAAACVIALASSACGGGAAPAKAPSDTPSTDEERAPPAGYGQPGAAPPHDYQQEQQPGQYPGSAVGPTGPFAEAPPLTLEEALVALDRAATELGSSESDCASACKAFESMERSRDRICELNGADDPGRRCQKAKERVESARELLGRRCGSCPP